MQPLYTVTATFTSAGAETPAFVDTRRVGFRTLALVTDDDADPQRLENATGSGSLTTRLKVNGASIVARGSNVIPLDEFAGRADADALALQMASAAAAGMNLLLVWGGGIFPYEAALDAADELGLMLYQVRGEWGARGACLYVSSHAGIPSYSSTFLRCCPGVIRSVRRPIGTAWVRLLVLSIA